MSFSGGDDDVVLVALSRARLLGRSASIDGTCNSNNGTEKMSQAADDCFAGGVATIDAFVRHYIQQAAADAAPNATAANSTPTVPYLVLPYMDQTSIFTELHPEGWGVNKKIMKDTLGWKLFLAPSTVLDAAEYDSYSDESKGRGNSSLSMSNHFRDWSGLQDYSFPLLLSDVSVPPSNPFSPYVQHVHFDPTTGLAVMFILGRPSNSFHVPIVAAARGLTRYIAKVNLENGCFSSEKDDKKQMDDKKQNTVGNPPGCWTPIMFVYAKQRVFAQYLQAVISDDALLPAPALIVDGLGTFPAYHTPTRVNGNNNNQSSFWVVSREIADASTYTHLQLTRSKKEGDRTRLADVQILQRRLNSLPNEWKDETYQRHMAAIGGMVEDALTHNRVIGQTGEMPRIGTSCRNGECPMGNLIADALRWKAQTQVGFVQASKLRGNGWDAGPVTVLDAWQAYPVSYKLCQGVMSGVSLYKLAEYSTRVAKFQDEKGSSLLQVSGMRLTYNAALHLVEPSSSHSEGQSRLTGLDIWNPARGAYEPVQRLALYSFATNSQVCRVQSPFATFTGGSFVMEGEIPGVIGNDSVISIIVDFLSTNHHHPTPRLPSGSASFIPYDTSLQGRLVNDTSTTAMDLLNLVQTPDSCDVTTFWDDAIQSCSPCPKMDNVVWLGSPFEFYSETGSTRTETSTAALVNGATLPVRVGPKSLPSWLKITQAKLNEQELGNIFATQDALLLPTGARLSIAYQVWAENLEPGSAQGQVAFGVAPNGDLFRGCGGLDATFTVIMRVDPPLEMNYLGNIRFVGWALAGIVLVSVACLVTWVHHNTHINVVRTMQPIFLYAICLGIGIIGCSLVTVGFDDEIVSDDVSSFMCMVTPWLLSVGFTISAASLFSKLLRINMLLNAGRFVRRTVSVKDVHLPGSIMLSLNVIVLLLWTIFDPLTWLRVPLQGEQWNTYGTCKSKGAIGNLFLGLTTTVAVTALLAAVWQAFKARDLSDEHSESKYVGVAVFGWFQILLVSLPVLFLIDDDNTHAKYVLQVAVIFAVCSSMLGLIFAPIIWNTRKLLHRGRHHVHISGLDDHQAQNSGFGDKSDRSRFENMPKNRYAEPNPGDEEDPSNTQSGATSSTDRSTVSLQRRGNDKAEGDNTPC